MDHLNSTSPPGRSPITACFVNITAAEKAELILEKLQHRASAVFKLYYGYLVIPFAVIALILNIIFVMAVCSAIKKHRVSRKCYVLIINRAVGDIIATVAAMVTVTYVLVKVEPNRDLVQVMDTFFIASFWSALISYTALSSLKLYAVARPFNYRKTVTMKRCLYLVVISWVFFAFVLVYTLGITALTKIPALQAWSGCRLETCLRTMYRTRNTFMTFIYFFTIICFIGTVFFVHRARKFVSSFHQKDSTARPRILRNRFPMWKLALNVGTFAIFHIFYVIWALGLLTITDLCFFQRNYPAMMRLLGLVRLSLLTRMLLDPILSFVTDFQIKRSMLSLFNINATVQPFDSRKQFAMSTSETNSSDNASGTPAGADKTKTTTISEGTTIRRKNSASKESESGEPPVSVDKSNDAD
uniref:G_PROTEIN_RECEP_F1_2 domain-containing protein n=1 Tax=Panagrellus redivivus TaxID=6233 RepID=A0A7E4UN14_PANRE